MIVVVHSGSINFRKTGTIRTRGVLSKKDEKKVLAFFLVLLPKSKKFNTLKFLRFPFDTCINGHPKFQ